MSEPKRYDNFQYETAGGEYVLYTDYAKLKAEVERLAREQRMKAIPVEAKLLERYALMQAENTRLRKAGDKMASGLQGMAGEYPKALADEWHDAKEGKV